MKICFSCAATESDGASFSPKPYGEPRLCDDCARSVEREELNRISPLFEYRRHATVTTRASYRAKLRVRSASPQGDMVDGIVPLP